jgi:ATP-dependent DNA ligase
MESFEGHPWARWIEFTREGAESGQRMPGGWSRWNAGKDLSFEPLRADRVVEVAYEHMQGDRFRHAARFRRWRPDKDPSDCTYAQLETTVPEELAKVFGATSS